MTTEDFREHFPEFRTVSSDLLEVFLLEAAHELNATLYGDKLDAAQAYLAAHRLVTSPFGKSARLVDDEKLDTYLRQFVAIRRQVAPRIFVT